MRRPFRLTLGLMLVLLLALLAALTALLATEGGLRFSLSLAQRFAPGELNWAAASGRLAGSLQVYELRYRDGDLQIDVGRLELTWSPGQLLVRRLRVDRLHLDNSVVQLPASEETDATPIEPGWQLPLALEVRDLAVTGLRIQTGTAEPVELQSLQVVAASGRDRVDFETFRLQLAQAQVTARGRLGLGRDVMTDIQLTLDAEPAGYAPVHSQGHISGTWASLTLEQQLEAPVAATARLDLAEPFGALHWVLDMELPVTALERIHTGWPAWRMGGRVHGTGALNQAELSADLHTDWEAGELYPLHGELSLVEADDGSLRLQPLLLQQGAARLQLTGDWHPQAETFALLLDGQTLQWPLQGDAQVEVPRAGIRVAGRLVDYQQQLTADLSGIVLPPVSLTGQGHGSDRGLDLEQLALSTLGGVIDVRGRFDWSPQLQWEAVLEARDIDPAQRWPDWPGRLAARAEGRGAVVDGDMRLAARIDALTGALRGYPVSGQAAVELEGGQLDAQRVELRSGSAQLNFAGQVGDAWALQWTLKAPDLEEVLPGVAGRIEAQGSVAGPRAEPHVQGHARLADITRGDLRLANFDLDADLSPAPGAPLKLQGHGEALSIGARRLDEIDVQLDGRVDAHQLRLEAKGPGHVLQLAGAGGWDGAQWQGRLEQSAWQLPETGAWKQRAPAVLRLGQAGSSGDDLCWEQQTADLCLHLQTAASEQRARLVLHGLPLGDRVSPFLPPQTQITDATLTFELQAQRGLQPGSPLLAQLDAHIGGGTVNWVGDTGRESTAFGGVEADARLTNAGLSATAALRLTGDDQLQLSARLPGYRPGMAADRAPLSGQLRGEVRDLTLVEGLLGNVDQLEGVLRAAVDLDGTLAVPRLAGELRLDNGRAFIGPSGTTLEDLQLVVSGDPVSGRIRLRGAARSGPGTLALNGDFEGAGTPELRGRLQITGTDFEAVNLPEARVLLAPDLRLDVQPRRLSVNGSLTIPEALIEPRDLQGAQTPSRDVVMISQDEQPPPGWAVTSRVKMVLGEAVHFIGFGLNGRLTGTLDVVDEPGRVTLASGELRIVDGEYKAYGQKLEIETGRLLYRGGPLDNPALDIRAVRKTGDVLAGVKVFGDLQLPELELFSQPGMPQADQLSYLLLGRPVQSASGSEGQMLFNAASSLGLKGGNLLAQNIGASFGLDEVSVGGGDDLDSAALVIGKYLTPRLYVNYSVGLLDVMNTLQIRYQLSKHLSVQTETGTATGGDILYSFER
jgi:translocation and assembly module TamB